MVLKPGKTGNTAYKTLEEAMADGAVTENVGKSGSSNTLVSANLPAGQFIQVVLNFMVISFTLYAFLRCKRHGETQSSRSNVNGN